MNTMPTFIALLFLLIAGMAMGQERPSDQVFPQKRPFLTSCFSADMETFRCRWNVGTFQNLSEPDSLRLFYYIKKPIAPSPQEWRECPQYSTDRANECFFSRNHTSIWTSYRVQLRSKDQDVVYDELRFHVEHIVRPDPPVRLNWTLLSVALTASHFDIMVSWEPPETADVKTGWITLQYEIQYREANATPWKVVDLEKGTQRSIYGLRTNVDHEVRIRCKMSASSLFGEFSESLLIHIPSKESQFPVAVFLIFAALCLIGILMLFIISQQQKLMVILLPPVPGPKIKGIDPELLKKGKLAELTSILGGHPDLRPELYNNDPWVEFIELDIEEPTEKLADLDTDCLMDRSPSADCPPLSVGFRDDDSGRASCCDPDLPCDADASSFQPLLPNTTHQEPPGPTASDPSGQTATSGDSLWAGAGRGDMYTQVSEVRPSGEVVLTLEEKTTDMEPAEKPKLEPKKEKAEKEFQLVVEKGDSSGYTSELDVGKMSPGLSTGEPEESPSAAPVEDYQTSSDMSSVSPAPVYTVVEGVDRQNSLLLTPSPLPHPQLITAKAITTPEGYLTPDLLGNVTP